MRRTRLAVRLCRRLLRDRRKWWAAGVYAVASAFVTGSFLVFESLAISPEQVLERDLGRFSATIGYGSEPVQPGSSWPGPMEEAVASAGFRETFISLSVMGVSVDGTAVALREGRWSTSPFPDRFKLSAGRWPESPGEVVVAMRDAGDAPEVGKRLSLLSGYLNLRVVGTATDRFGGNVTSYLAGDGTWSHVPPKAADAFPLVSAMPMVYWNGSGQAAMARAFTRGHPSGDLGFEEVLGTLASAALLQEQTSGQTAVQGNLFAYSLPSVAVPVAGAAIWIGLVGGRLRRNRLQLTDLGCGRWVAALGPIGSASVPLALAALLGVALGAAMVAVSRPWLASWHDQPLSRVPMPWDPLARCLGVALGASVLAALWLRGGGASRKQRMLRQPRLNFPREARRWTAVVALVPAVLALPFATTVSVGMGVAAASVLIGAVLAPDVLSIASRRMAKRRLQFRLAGRQLESSSAASSGVAVIAAMVGAAVAFTTLLSTMIATMDDRQTPKVLPGQMIINSPDIAVHRPASKDALEQLKLAKLPDRAVVIQLRFLRSDADDRDRFVISGSDEYLMAVDDARQAQALLGDAWRETYKHALVGGGLVRWINAEEGESAEGERVSIVAEGSSSVLATLEAVNADWPRVDWARGVAGLTLTSTARAHGLPLSDGEVIVANVEADVTGQLRGALRAQGLDEDLVVGYEAPPPPIPPAGLVATAVALAAVALLMVTACSASRVSELRPRLGILLANGVGPRWLSRCVLLQEAVVVVTGVSVGLLAGAVPILLCVPRFGGFWTVSLPLGQIAALIAACVFGSAVAAAIGSWRLRPTITRTGEF